MNIQSLSIVVPTGKCWNHCKFCVSHMHHEDYGKSIITNDNCLPESYINRIKFVRDEGCNSMVITGTAEPQQNLPFIYALLKANKNLPKPFYNISLQTTGSGLDENSISRLADLGLTTLALSINSFDDKTNWDIADTPYSLRKLTLLELIWTAKKYNLNVRACFNLTAYFSMYGPADFFNWAAEHKVDQVTFRKIYKSGDGEEAKWVENNEFSERQFTWIKNFVERGGIPIARLPYGFIQFSVNGISTVIDDNCMAKNVIDENKYAILRPNGHLYSRWDDKGSLIF